MPNMTFTNLIDPHVVDRGSAKNSFTAYQDVAGASGSGLLLPVTVANELKLGSIIRLEAWGEFTTTGTPPTMSLGFIYGATRGAAGGVAIGQTSLATAPSSAAAWPWHAKWCGKVRAVGDAGTIYGSGILDLGSSLTAFTPQAMPPTAAARNVTGIDTTLAKAWGVGVQFGTSNASHQVIVDIFNVEILNQGKT